MAYDLEEQEKLDAIKAWWARYGTLVVSLFAAVALAWGGWWGWKAYESHRTNQAMGYFEALEDAARLGGADSSVRIKAAAATLREQYPATGYAARGALVAAQALQAQKDDVGAREQLEWLAAQGKNPSMQAVARLRLAGMLLDQKQFDAALAQLNNPPAAFAALFADRRGDVLAAQGKRDEARAAWQSAIDGLGTANPLTQVVQLKLDALSGA
ncbi:MULTISPECIES: YfgM family protein [Achromobacter]|uniref:Ancillary SecYEG translocon subunit n=1 Tax=Achromobacter spanius TaxID=217203 RepID=A0ABY8GU36_9BURK|nr:MULTISPECIES: tetratricopeptide repeat protein [Achromobacter]WAI82390.1 tetratricopeptide repeat protein [Achromobacter spanius]WEX92477.1 tetratricopeptide repeat protein [Achromobacter sp. SS2-2022]WFP08370.1 tetratricopeptide repeat protein [Achromobacter spanius]